MTFSRGPPRIERELIHTMRNVHGQVNESFSPCLSGIVSFFGPPPSHFIEWKSPPCFLLSECSLATVPPHRQTVFSHVAHHTTDITRFRAYIFMFNVGSVKVEHHHETTHTNRSIARYTLLSLEGRDPRLTVTGRSIGNIPSIASRTKSKFPPSHHAEHH